MPAFFHRPLHDRFGTWPLGYIPYGGGSVGEVEAVARAVGDGDDGAYHAAWVQAADRLADEAAAVLARGHRASARALLLRASAFYSASYPPLFGDPPDPRLRAAYRRQVQAFEAALALGDPPVTPLRIPFEGGSMPGYLLPAVGREREVRPLVILTNGYDGSLTAMYFASAVAATQRGYHCLVFDGPGQGEMLVEQGVKLRADWETVVRAVVDTAQTLPGVDAQRIAIWGWSLGGYLAPRAASGEPRLAACIADPGQWGIGPGMRAMLVKMGVPPAQAQGDPADLDAAVLDGMQRAVAADPHLHWNIVQRGFWVHGVATLRDYLRAAVPYTMEDRIGLVRCPTFVGLAEADPLAAGSATFFDALQCPKTLVRFTAAEGASGHCEMNNRPVFNQRALDWLDEVFGQP